MPKKSKSSALDQTRGRLLALASVVISGLFVVSVARNVMDQTSTGQVNAPNSLALIVAILAAAVSWWWEKRVRILVAFSIGLIVASYAIWQFGLHY